MTGTKGFIVDCFTGVLKGRAVVFAIGRLETGETFGLVDDRRTPTVFVRVSDADAVKDFASQETSLSTMDGESVLALTAPDMMRLRNIETRLMHNGIRTYEGDVDFALSFLMEQHFRGSIVLDGAWRRSEQLGRVYINPHVTPSDWEPNLRVLSFDIETDVESDRVLAVSLVIDGQGTPSEEILVLGEPRAEDPAWLRTYATEVLLLKAFNQRVKELDPDIVTGWNIIDFDLPTLEKRFKRFGIPWQLGRTKEGQRQPSFAGRQVLDALRLVRSSSLHLPDLKLDTVAEALLGRRKAISAEYDEDKAAKILETYHNDRLTFATYCLEDARLVRDILRQEKLLELSISRTRLIGLPLAKASGSVASFDFIYMSELRQRGFVAPTRGTDQPEVHEVAGGLVLEPQPGLYPHILVFDFRSLYPSIIRTFNIDPLAHAQAKHGGEDLLRAPNQAAFCRTRGILPEMLDRFFESRARAQQGGDAIASYAYKIMMNSFYGVLGTDACRFASPELAGAITAFGHEILRWARAYLEGLGFNVLYGDTDSLFVDTHFAQVVTPEEAVKRGKELSMQVSQDLAEHLRNKYRVLSRLELKFEKYYRWFLLPSSRGGQSRAKSYAGWIQDGRSSKLDIVGMEAVRSDWTPLARDLQRQLLQLLFLESPPLELKALVRKTVSAVRKGQLDAELVYQKRMRRELTSYTSTTPPHVKAARLLPKPPRLVRYQMTMQGPQPLGYVNAQLDYEHYICKQVLPIAATIFDLVGFDAEEVCLGQGQERLF